jgi:hypothetical protein
VSAEEEVVRHKLYQPGIDQNTGAYAVENAVGDK